jgi:DinB superfamily
MNGPVEAAVTELEQVRAQLLRALENTPDDRLNWSPAPTARTPLQLVAHSSYSLGFIQAMFAGSPYPTPTMAEADAEFLEMDSKITNRAQAIELFESKCAAFVDFLRGLNQEDLQRMTDLPFNLGSTPLEAILGVGSMHTRSHFSQLDYLQTCYGDRAW